jgi:hypothetical protein
VAWKTPTLLPVPVHCYRLLGWQLAASTVQTTNTLDVHILRPLTQADNTISSVANTNMNAKWLVQLNNYRLDNLIAGI